MRAASSSSGAAREILGAMSEQNLEIALRDFACSRLRSFPNCRATGIRSSDDGPRGLAGAGTVRRIGCDHRAVRTSHVRHGGSVFPGCEGRGPARGLGCGQLPLGDSGSGQRGRHRIEDCRRIPLFPGQAGGGAFPLHPQGGPRSRRAVGSSPPTPPGRPDSNRDLTDPNGARYQAAPRPERAGSMANRACDTSESPSPYWFCVREESGRAEIEAGGRRDRPPPLIGVAFALGGLAVLALLVLTIDPSPPRGVEDAIAGKHLRAALRPAWARLQRRADRPSPRHRPRRRLVSGRDPRHRRRLHLRLLARAAAGDGRLARQRAARLLDRPLRRPAAPVPIHLPEPGSSGSRHWPSAAASRSCSACAWSRSSPSASSPTSPEPPGCRSPRFVWTTVVGYLPITVVFVYLGNQLEELSPTDPILWAGAAVLILLVFVSHGSRR